MSATGQSIGIERKTIEDLITSIPDRLPMQLYRQIEEYEVPILLIEGYLGRIYDQIVSYGQVYNMTWQQIWNFLRTWQDKGISLEITCDLEHTATRLEQIYDYYQKPAHSGGITRNSTGDSRLIALQCPGIGLQTASKLINAFGSLQKIANADYLDLAKVVSMKNAKQVYLHFRKE